MAKRSYSKKGSRIEPAVHTATLITPTVTAGSVGSFTIDLSQVASLLNRRFYRQGINWAVAGFKLITTANGNVSITKLPNTWVMSNAWTKGFKTWQKMNSQALAESESVRPKFLDFKIYADAFHHQAGFAANLLPVDAANVPYAPGEWVPSKYVIPDTTQGATGGINNYEIIATGPSYPGGGASSLNAVSLIEGYAASRSLPNIKDPNTPGDAADASGTSPENWMSALFNEGSAQDDQVLTDMIFENNEAPYPFEDDGTHTDTMYPGGANQAPTLEHHDSAIITPTTIGGITMMKGGNFPCGLIRINWNPTEVTSGLRLEVDLIPGNHRGYLCEPMMEM